MMNRKELEYALDRLADDGNPNVDWKWRKRREYVEREEAREAREVLRVHGVPMHRY